MINGGRTMTTFDGNGDLRECLRAHDWNTSPLGPPALWPPELLTVVRLMLNSKFAMFVAWGPELALIYNDEYVPMLGEKHPACLGRPMPEVWAEIWPVIAPIANAATQGRSVFLRRLAAHDQAPRPSRAGMVHLLVFALGRQRG